MQPQFSFFLSIAFSFIAWVIVSARYIWPELRLRQRAEALRPLLILHSFRFIGLAFLVPGAAAGRIAGQGGAAERLGLKRTTLQNKIRRLGITKVQYQN